MSPTGPPPFPIDAFATFTVCIAILAVVLRKIAHHLPFHVPLRSLLSVVAGLVALCGIDACAQQLPGGLAAAVLGVGLVVFSVWRWRTTAPAREAWRQRIEQARGRERRRAPPPLPSAGPSGGAP